MSTVKRLSLKGAALLLVIAVMVLAGPASFPKPAYAYCLWGVTITDYYSTGGVCYTDCPNTRVCYGDTSGYIYDSQMGECWYCIN